MKHALSTAIVTVDYWRHIEAYLCKQPEVISTIGNAVGIEYLGMIMDNSEQKKGNNI